MAKLYLYKHEEHLETYDLDTAEEYFAGRSSECEIVLSGDQKISRQHVRIFFNGDNWQVEVVARFGAMSYGGKETNGAHLIDESRFTIGSFEFRFEPTSETEDAAEYSDGEHLPAVLGDDSDSMLPATLDDDMPDDEVTSIGQIEGVPFVRVVGGDGEEPTTLRLEGNFWLAGRESNSPIRIKDRRVSRNQFQIYKNDSGYFVKDLGSVNGTLLNGNALLPDEPASLVSGDVISVLDTQIYFEIRDANFNERVLAISPQVNVPAFQNQQYAMQNYLESAHHMPPQQGEFAGVGGPAAEDEGPYELTLNDLKDGSWKKKMKNLDKKSKFRVAMVALIAIFGFIAILPQGPPQATKQVESTNPFDQLSPEDQEFVKRTYVLAKNLYMQGRYELASGEIAKIHDKIDSYEDSIQIAEYAKEAIKIREEKERIEKERKERLELEEEARAIIARCKQEHFEGKDTVDVDTLSVCLSPARDRVGIEADSHPLAAEILNMIERANEMIEERIRREAEQADYKKRVAKGRSLWLKAEKLRKQGLPHKSIAQYRRHLNSVFPDPKALKKDSRRKIASIQKEVDRVAMINIRKADELYDRQDLRHAILELDKAIRLKKVDPELSDKRKQMVNELTKRMRFLYQESVLEESLGNLEAAKDRWFKIIDLDIPGGTYHKRSTIKLKKYGDI